MDRNQRLVSNPTRNRQVVMREQKDSTPPATLRLIADKYLIRYAQEASWREDNRRVSNGN